MTASHSLVDSLVKTLGENGFKYLSEEFDSEVSDFITQKGFYHCEDMCDFEKFNETLPSKNEFYSSLSGKWISDKEYHILSKFIINLEWKIWKAITICT